MLQMITGGSGSGKSAYAQKLIKEAGEGERYYIATMIPTGEEGLLRVKRHQKLREGMNFHTIACRTGLDSVEVPDGAIVLLEDLSNLVANEMYEPEGAHEQTEEAVLDGIEKLNRQAKALYVVTNEVFADGISYGEETRRYQKVLGEINQTLCDQADRIFEIVYGIPVVIRETPEAAE